MQHQPNTHILKRHIAQLCVSQVFVSVKIFSVLPRVMLPRVTSVNPTVFDRVPRTGSSRECSWLDPGAGLWLEVMVHWTPEPGPHALAYSAPEAPIGTCGKTIPRETPTCLGKSLWKIGTWHFGWWMVPQDMVGSFFSVICGQKDDWVCWYWATWRGLWTVLSLHLMVSGGCGGGGGGGWSPDVSAAVPGGSRDNPATPE